MEFYNCGNEANVEGGKNCAAFLGCNYDGDIAIIMSNCYNTGNIKGNEEAAALSGWIGNHGNSRVDHCYNAGTVTGMDNVGNNLFRGTASGAWYIDNCFDTNYSHNCPKVDAGTLASGELCYRLNQGQSDPQWHQRLGTDGKPLPVGTGNFVYRNGDFYCYGVSKGTESYSNSANANTDPHQFAAADDLCDVCFQHSVMSGREPQQAGGTYQISSIGNLVWFANAVNSGAGVTYNAALTADIDQGQPHP